MILCSFLQIVSNYIIIGFHDYFGNMIKLSINYELLYRWAELTRKIEFHVEVQELNDSGEYAPVEVQPRTTVGTGGIFQLRQGQQRRIKVHIKPIHNSGMLPIICESVVSMAIGCPVVRSELQKPMDSYQEVCILHIMYNKLI